MHFNNAHHLKKLRFHAVLVDVHPLNALEPIVFTENGIVISSNDVQSWNVPSLMVFTEEITTWFYDLHRLKT